MIVCHCYYLPIKKKFNRAAARMKSLFCRRLCSCFCGKNPAVGQAAGSFAWILFACAQLLHAVGADVLAAVVLDVPAVTAEDAGRLVLLENNGLAVDIDFDSVLLRDVQRAAQLAGQNDSAELVDLSDDAC